MKSCVFKQSKDVIFRQEEDEAILFNPESSEIVVINSTGCYIWKLLHNKLKREDVLTKILDRFEVTQEQADRDLDKFIAALKKGNFIFSEE